jgi:hypothetical protein
MLAPLWATLAILAGMLAITGLNVAVWTEADMVLPLAASLLMLELDISGPSRRAP